MAGDWIKMRCSLSTDPDVVRIATGLNLDRFAVVGRLHAIWSWANEHLTDGQDVPIDAEFLDSLIATPGFTAAIRHVGWLTGRDGSLCFPQFSRHNGSTAKSRALDSVRKQRVRNVSEKCPDSNRTNSGPEKRREEKRRVIKNTGVKRFIPPTVAEVSEYCQERGNRVDAQTFVDHYEANGWIRGKAKIKDWKACVRTWEQNSNGSGKYSGTGGNTAAAKEQRNADAFALVFGEGNGTGDHEAV